MSQLTVLIPCRNEERHIEACIESARLVADEILVADSLSTDSTVARVRAQDDCRLIERVYRTPSDFRNWAMGHAQHDWILVVDADERVTPALAEEIRQTLAGEPACVAYRIAHDNFILGHPIRYGGWTRHRGPIRLFRRSVCCYGARRVHESIQVPAGQSVGVLQSRFQHLTTCTLTEYVEKQNRYSLSAAEDMAESGKPCSLLALFFRGMLRFCNMYFFRLGFLDGVPGFILSVVMAQYVFLKHAKLWEIQTLGERATEADMPSSISFEQAAQQLREQSQARRDGRRKAA